jgi:2-oxoglutarate ferredoxin oxidoreductase subunit gamma
MLHSTIFSGFGGQGILFAGHVLAEAAVIEGRDVSWMPSYGPEMRGGTASCTVILADAQIGSPVVDRYDAAVVMNPPSLGKFAPRVAPNGLLVVNTSLVGLDDVPPMAEGAITLPLPCTELAAAGGDDKLVSVVALGALVERTAWVTPEAVIATIRAVVGEKRPHIVQADIGAFEAGRAAVAREAVGSNG